MGVHLTPMEPIAVARAEREGANDARRGVRSKLSGLRILFGDEVHHPIDLALEVYEERCEDAFRTYERAYEADGQAARAAVERQHQMGTAIQSHLATIDRLSTELERRHRKAGTKVPEWIASIRSDFEVPF